MLIATTELDAVNIVLSSIGSDPVNSLDDESDVDISNALLMIERVSRDIQRKGWDFNRGDYTLYPDVNTKRIQWDKNIIRFRNAEDDKVYAKRGDFIKNLTDNTFEFDDPITLEVTMALDFDDLPDCFRSYIAARAALDFQAKFMGDANVSSDLQYNLQEAWADIVQYDMDMGDYNMLQLTNVASVLQRT